MTVVIGIIIGLVVGIGIGMGYAFKTIRLKNKQIDFEKKLSEKHLDLFRTTIQWVYVLQDGKRIENYLKNKGYQNIAIYGMGQMGEALFRELRNSPIDVRYCIDRNASGIYGDYKVYTPDEELEQVDVVVITAISFFDEIACSLSHKMDCDFISLEDIVYEI